MARPDHPVPTFDPKSTEISDFLFSWFLSNAMTDWAEICTKGVRYHSPTTCQFLAHTDNALLSYHQNTFKIGQKLLPPSVVNRWFDRAEINTWAVVYSNLEMINFWARSDNPIMCYLNKHCQKCRKFGNFTKMYEKSHLVGIQATISLFRYQIRAQRPQKHKSWPILTSNLVGFSDIWLISVQFGKFQEISRILKIFRNKIFRRNQK